MSFQYRPRRSVLYTPAHEPRHIEKARHLPVDTIVFDLQESVPPQHKPDGRALLLKALENNDFGYSEKVIRINSLDSEWGMDDLRAAVSLDIDAILFPNVESGGQLKASIATLDEAGGSHLAVMANIESPKGVLRSEEIAATSDRLTAMVLGTTDLANALRINLTADRLGLLTSLSMTILAARAHNKCIIDGPHFDLKNIEACEFSCRQARDLGFDGKAVIHPVQLAYTNDAFTPKGEDVKRAKKIIDAIAEAHEIGRSIAVINDRLIEPSLELWARRVIALYNQVHELGQTELIGPEK
ncbi:HpcH/HpaI aldolase/citrate lyase family protein [Aliikangiella coralliicola]|uniref:HpcH/HpaI aldolase/citrate lyase family protein n=1 Tax=Aliikangiella coralliicola TaxID=2592383 RepID=UPI00143D0E33|nr:CoA ester lyase [Aliikangiella coralliicola]